MKKTKSYIALFIISSDKQDIIEDIKKKIISIINENSGEILKEDMIGKRELAYHIKKKKFGIYYEINFNALPESINIMKKEFEIDTNILRTLIDKN